MTASKRNGREYPDMMAAAWIRIREHVLPTIEWRAAMSSTSAKPSSLRKTDHQRSME